MNFIFCSNCELNLASRDASIFAGKIATTSVIELGNNIQGYNVKLVNKVNEPVGNADILALLNVEFNQYEDLFTFVFDACRIDLVLDMYVVMCMSSNGELTSVKCYYRE